MSCIGRRIVLFRAHHVLPKELKEEDRNFMRMDDLSFKELLGVVTPINKRYK